VAFHEPVMLAEVLESLLIRPGIAVVDGTLGTGGHSLEIARRLGPQGFLLGMDRDPEMLAIGSQRLRDEFDGRADAPAIHFAGRPYEEVGAALAAAGRHRVDAVLLDLGVNSLHLDMAERGFSFLLDGPLDGRFNRQNTRGTTMADLVNTSSERQLADWIHRWGDERHARRIASRIVATRRTTPITTTAQLAALVVEAYPPRERFGRIHPATRTFQALRIVANDELGHVERGVRACLEVLAPGGVLGVISFHSGEDRLVKQIFREVAAPRPDPNNPYSATTLEGVEFHQDQRQAVFSSEEEAARNPRSRSARLRVVRRREVEPC
jgi:16S rRNA (cytosine1402-N4)-methyltransferase